MARQRSAAHRLPLDGWRVVVTRAREDSATLGALLAAQGATVVSFPTIVRVAPRSPVPMVRALARIDRFDWLVFTSPHAVTVTMDRLRGSRRRLPPIAVVGGDTQRALVARGRRAALVPALSTAEGLAAELLRRGIAGGRVLFPRARGGRETIPQQLTAAGARVTVVTAYETRRAPRPTAARLRALDGATALVFTSPSTVRAFMALAGRGRSRRLLAGRIAAAIGPTTAAALAPYAPREIVAPANPSLEGLVAALADRARRAPAPAP